MKTAATIHLGFELQSGKPVEIPCAHTVITGQTQQAGKTTALEAMIARSGLRAVCFVTKRGEGSFNNARRIDPYFREQGDWQFVASILEASRGEKLRFERAWIIRASRGAKTLADVQRNVRAAMETAKGMSADVYLTLDAYLDAVVPQIESVKWARSIQLSAGVSAMDLSALNVEMQHLVIRSTIDWVLNKEENTVVVVPEAWKFIPQGRGTPVKLAAESFIRQAAGLRNYLWLDSQDIAGVEKIIIKSIPVWILGVQRESNEIKRTLDQIPAGIKKPKPEAIATLGIGQFFVCHGVHIHHAYVQPAWMDADTARAIAVSGSPTPIRHHEPEPPRPERQTTEVAVTPPDTETESMDAAAFAKELMGEIRKLSSPAAAPPEPQQKTSTPPAAGEDELYERFKARLVADAPALIRVLADRPEIQIKIDRRTIETSTESAAGMLAILLSEGFFTKPVKATVAWKELQRRWNYGGISQRIYEQLDKLTSLGFVTKEGEGYKAVDGIKSRIVHA